MDPLVYKHLVYGKRGHSGEWKGTATQWIKSDLYSWTPKTIPAHELVSNGTEFPDNALRKHLYYFLESNHLGEFLLHAQTALKIASCHAHTVDILNKFLSQETIRCVNCVCVLLPTRCQQMSPFITHYDKNVSKRSSNEGSSWKTQKEREKTGCPIKFELWLKKKKYTYLHPHT